MNNELQLKIEELIAKYKQLVYAHGDLSVELVNVKLERDQLLRDYGTCSAERDTLKLEVERLKANEIENAKTHYSAVFKLARAKVALEKIRDDATFDISEIIELCINTLAELDSQGDK